MKEYSEVTKKRYLVELELEVPEEASESEVETALKQVISESPRKTYIIPKDLDDDILTATYQLKLVTSKRIG